MSDHQANSFPRQAVHADTVFVALRRFETLGAASDWRERLPGPSTTMLLAPGARSGLR